ncbi:conserved hypothetical protein [Kribbella flavida DSM 17836]|uniref:Winged helix DNA-binding domain-containing protein n=1 Tax=Kribbella flavida (strain DSM 17836 / JCM 10339 / NBRC 14399) TaxID=479435 RepID=D2PM09_KRIFD|nr:winged helix DNA-binding domain-containing protein [Kribbella flavida]ADB32589.1 conserved hypothetical protein [Kribbella flavida DSM 17836]
MVLTERELNRAAMARQMLVAREAVGVEDAVRRVVAVQAQHAASPYVALFNRVAGFDPAELDRAFAEQRVVKASLLRMTLHAVCADEHAHFRAVMMPATATARFAQSFAAGGLTAETSRVLAAELLQFASEPRTGAELEAWLGERLGTDAAAQVWWAMRSSAHLLHAPTGGPWSFGQRPVFVAAPWAEVLDAEKATEVLVRRYLQGFGPASVADIAQFAKITRSRVKVAISALSGELEELKGPGGVTLYDVPGAPRPAGDLPVPPRLMAMWDSVLLAYDDRGRVVPPEYKAAVTRTNGDVLPTLLVDGYVAGVWRGVESGIEAAAFQHLPDDVWQGLAAEARALSEMLRERDPKLYRSYDRWWNDVPVVETRVLATG